MSTGARWLTASFGVLIALFAVAALASGPADAERDYPASARAACEHWRNVARDAGAGVLTTAELRAKLIEVEDIAGGSEVAPAARRLLGQVTQGQDPTSGIAALNRACDL